MEEYDLKLSNKLSKQRTNLSVRRTLMSADRSLMSWIRTALALIGIGLTVYKFLQFLEAKETAASFQIGGPRKIGLFLIALGTFSVVLGSIQYWLNVKILGKEYGFSPWRFPLIISFFVAMLGLVLFLGIFLQVNLV